MKKGKSTEVQLLEPTVYWERKLGINFETEFICYKRLCERKLSKKEIRKLDEINYLTYGEWEQKMTATLITLKKSELYEYIHFLYGRINHYDVVISLYSSMLFPILVGFFCPYILMLIDQLANIPTAVYLIIALIILVVVIGWLFKDFYKLIIESKDVSSYRSLYADLAHIAEKHYKELTEN